MLPMLSASVRLSRRVPKVGVPGSCMPLGLAGGSKWAVSGLFRPQMPTWPGSTPRLLPFPRGNLGWWRC
jgi:hypothetical protein